MRLKPIFLFFLSPVFLLINQSCGVESSDPKEENIEEADYKEFYFPIAALSTPKVYCYQSSDSEFGELYWKLQTFQEGEKQFLQNEAFRRDSLGTFIPIERLKEEIRENGAFAEEMIVYTMSEDGELLQTEATNRIKRLFFWEWDVHAPATWFFAYESQNFPGYDREVRRERNFTDEHGSIKFEGKDHEAIYFIDDFTYVLIDQESGERDSFSFTQKSSYAKGVGMYQYTRYLPDNETITFTLEAIYSMAQWEEMQQ